jgi:carbon-monoxide dehydrogenase medium subunit
MVGVALWLELNDDSTCKEARITLFGVSGKPLRMERAEQRMTGEKLDESAFEEVGKIVSDELDPDSDIHASALYRKEVGGVLTRRALAKAFARVTEGNA